MSIVQIQVLVVEDDEVISLAIRTMLERLGCRVDTVANGVEAIECFGRQEYDLILMGWQMPLMDGFEATARIRALPGGSVTPIVATTAARDRAECLAAGMNDRMPQPFLIEGLRAVLEKWTLWEDHHTTDEV